ncbi:sulfate transporter-like [Mytilus californianus]|uniref:sulfate transporter-like n=1 Tax=Mytilus californianus TaxID=6549 RepID=UPI00224651BE|nr:sulfate transporter-like [Mytilus californianus]
MTELHTSRRIYTKEKLDSLFEVQETRKESLFTTLRKQCYCSKRRTWKCLTSFFPIIKIVKCYKKDYIVGDLIAGLTVSFMHLPQGLAFSVLAGLPAVFGLYTTFFPLLFYTIFGTSPYVAFATNAVIALIVQKIVLSEVVLFKSSLLDSGTNTTVFINMSDTNNNSLNLVTNGISEYDIIANKASTAMAASFLVGLILTTLGLLRLGFLLTYMSESFIGGFTTAAGIHIVSSQVPKMFGIEVSAHTGAGKLVKMYIELFSNLEKTVISDVVITVICITVILVVKVCVNDRFKNRMKIPIPIDLIVVVVSTLISHLAKFEKNLGVSVIGDIPSGFRPPAIPPLDIAPRILVDCIIMAILTLMLTISLAKLTAKTHNQRINDNQEMVAYGLTNILSSFFSCFPQSATPSRTMLDSDLGAETTLNSIPTIVFMFLVILWMGQLFQSLPMSVLAAMITVAMKNLILQFGDLPKIWRINKLDFVIWIISCFVSVLVNLDYGIIAGIAFSITSVVIQHQVSSGILIGQAGNENVFLDCEKRKNVRDHENIKIFRFQAPLYFANAGQFKTQINRKIIDPIKLKNRSKKKTIALEMVNGQSTENSKLPKDIGNSMDSKKLVQSAIHYIIIDCQMISHIDLSGISMLSQVIKEYKSVEIEIFLTNCSSAFLDTLTSAGVFENFPSESVFYDISDALHFIHKSEESERAEA